MTTYNDEENLEKDEVVPASGHKRISLHVLRQEMKRWESIKATPLQNYALVQVYLGLTEYLTPDGIYLMSQLTPLSRKLGFRQPQILLTLLCRSRSFTFICSSDLTSCYGFYSAATLKGKTLTHFELQQPELCQIAVNPRLTAFYNTLRQAEADTECCETSEDKSLCSNEVTPQNGIKKSKKTAQKVFNKISEFCSIYTNYILVNNIYIYHSVSNNPPTEEARNAQWMKTVHSVASAASPAPAEKPTYGTASDYFHEMNQSEARRSLFFQPQRAAISQRYHLSLDESRFVLIHIVNDYLIPQFNQQSRFLTTPPAGRDKWLRNIARSKYYLYELDHAYENAKSEIQAFRRQQAQQQCDELRSNHPLSPHEWTSPKSGKRLYQDPVCGVIELPEEAAPRPTATARWNRFTRQWTESTN